MFDKINQLKKQVDEIKNRLEHITVKGEAPGSQVVVSMNGNKKVTDIYINESFQKVSSLDELQDYILIAMNRAMEQAESVNESEMRSAAGSLLPGFGL